MPGIRAKRSWRAVRPRYEDKQTGTCKKGRLRYSDWPECSKACAESYSNILEVIDGLLIPRDE